MSRRIVFPAPLLGCLKVLEQRREGATGITMESPARCCWLERDSVQLPFQRSKLNRPFMVAIPSTSQLLSLTRLSSPRIITLYKNIHSHWSGWWIPFTTKIWHISKISTWQWHVKSEHEYATRNTQWARQHTH